MRLAVGSYSDTLPFGHIEIGDGICLNSHVRCSCCFHQSLISAGLQGRVDGRHLACG